MTAKRELLEDLRHSAETNCVLKLKIRHEANPIITAVEKVDGDRITLKPTCLYGYPIAKEMLTLADIETVKRYKTHFDNPLFARLRFVRSNISAIRENFEAFQQEIGLLKRA